MGDYPEKLQAILDDFAFITDRNERAEYLIELADRFHEVKVPESVATQPYPEENHVQQCESDAYVWAEPQDDGTMKYYFDVLNPQGLSAMAMSVILADAYNNQPPEEVAKVKTDLVFDIFGREVSMGKGQGLMGIIALVRHAAEQRLKDK